MRALILVFEFVSDCKCKRIDILWRAASVRKFLTHSQHPVERWIKLIIFEKNTRVSDTYIMHTFYSNMNDTRVQSSLWDSSSHEQKAVPVSSPLVNTHNADKSRKRTNTEEPHEKEKKPKIVLSDAETGALIKPPEDTKEDINVHASISSSISNSDTSIKDQLEILLELAQLLAKFSNSNEKLTLQYSVIKKYHVALIKENIIVVIQIKESNRKKYYGKFHKKFVVGEDLSASAKKLKYYLEKCLGKKTDLDTITLNLTEKFGREFQLDNDFQLNNNELDELYEDLKPNILYPLRAKIKMPQKIRNTTVFKKYKSKLADHVFEKVKGRFFVFTQDFLNRKTKLKGSFNELREKIIEKLQVEKLDFDDLNKYQFEIHNFYNTDVEMKLPQVDLIENSINFTNKIQNATKNIQNISVIETYNNSNNVPKIIVKNLRRDDKNPKDFRTKICDLLREKKDIQNKQVILKNDNELEIKSVNIKSAKAIVDLLTKKLSSNYKIIVEKIESPKMKIIGVDDCNKMTLEEIEKDLNVRNFSEYEEKCKVLHINPNIAKNESSIIIEVPRKIYKHIKESQNKICIGYQSCKVLDLINISQCQKCGRFGHKIKKCKNASCCLKCAGEHLSKHCDKPENSTCNNCFYSNSIHKKNYEVNHVANDTDKCAILKNKINRIIDMTDYPFPMRPNIPKYL